MTKTEFREKLREKIRDRVALVGTTNIVSEIVPTRYPLVSSRIYVTITDATSWGTIKIIGTQDKKIAQEETLTFSINTTKITDKFFSTIDKIECQGWVGGKITVSTAYKDFDDIELNNVIDEALIRFARYRPKFVTIEKTVTTNNKYDLPAGLLWIKSVWGTDGEINWYVENGQLVLSGYNQSSYSGYLTNELAINTISILPTGNFKIKYAVLPAIEEIVGYDSELLLCAEALCDRMKSEEPDRWVGYVTTIPGAEKLNVATEFREAYESKMAEFERLVKFGYGVRT